MEEKPLRFRITIRSDNAKPTPIEYVFELRHEMIDTHKADSEIQRRFDINKQVGGEVEAFLPRGWSLVRVEEMIGF